MKLFRNLFLMSAVAALLVSCDITLPVGATANPIGSKVGTSSGTCYLGILCFGVDASVQSAAKNGGITKVSTVDIKTSNILNIIVTYETIVTGN